MQPQPDRRANFKEQMFQRLQEIHQQARDNFKPGETGFMAYTFRQTDKGFVEGRMELSHIPPEELGGVFIQLLNTLKVDCYIIVSEAITAKMVKKEFNEKLGGDIRNLDDYEASDRILCTLMQFSDNQLIHHLIESKFHKRGDSFVMEDAVEKRNILLPRETMKGGLPAIKAE